MSNEMDLENSEPMPDEETAVSLQTIDETPLSAPTPQHSLPEAVYLLLAGAAIEIGGLTREWLLGEAAEPHQPSELTQGIIGAGLGMVKTAVSLSKWGLNVARFGSKVAWLMLPEPIAVCLEQQRARWVTDGKQALPIAKAETRQISAQVIDSIVQLVAASPAVRTLVEDQVTLALPDLLNNERVDALVTEQVTRLITEPEVQKLVQQQAGQYLDYLEQNSDQIERLVQGQSVGLAGEVLDEVREQMVTADALVERVVRTLFRRRRTNNALPPLTGTQ